MNQGTQGLNQPPVQNMPNIPNIPNMQMPEPNHSSWNKEVAAVIAVIVIALIVTAVWYFFPLISLAPSSAPEVNTQMPPAENASPAGGAGDTINNITNDLNQAVSPADLNSDLDSLDKDLESF